MNVFGKDTKMGKENHLVSMKYKRDSGSREVVQLIMSLHPGAGCFHSCSFTLCPFLFCGACHQLPDKSHMDLTYECLTLAWHDPCQFFLNYLVWEII